MSSLNRRDFLKLGGTAFVGVTLVPLLGGCESYTVTPLGGNARAPFLTPLDQFFVQNGGEGSITGWTEPNLTVGNWVMEIREQNGIGPDAFIQHRTITFSDLEAAVAKETTILKTMQCVLESPLRTTQTGLIANAYWTGVPLSHFLEGLSFKPGTRRFIFTGADGFRNNITLDRLNDTALRPPLLVYRMNGTPLTREHGAPVRLIIHEGFGYKNVKWITEVRATTSNAPVGTYQDQQFVDDGIMRVTSRSTTLRDEMSVPAGPVEVQGIAVSGLSPIAAVEISIDGGAFQAAELIPLDEIQQQEALPGTIRQIIEQQSYPYTAVWAPWRFRWEAPAGRHTLAIRATDAAGNVQPDVDSNIKDGNTSVTRIIVNVS